MSEKDHTLTSITFDEDGKEQKIEVKDIDWAFTRENALYLVTNRDQVYTFEINEEDHDKIFDSLHKANPQMILGAYAGERIGFSSLPNTRDLGGMQAKDGRFIRPHRLLRSAALHKINKEDKKRLENEFNVRLILDLRTDMERLSAPDPVILQAEHIHVPARNASTLDLLSKEVDAKHLVDLLKKADETMKYLYEDLVVSQQGLKAYRQFFQLILAQEEGSVLWHCTQGKDRTGIGAMLILSALGISKDAIYKDYLRTNEYLEAEKDDLKIRLKNHPEWIKDVDALYDARKEYLDIAYRSIEDNFGTMDNYLREGLGLDQKMIDTLQDRYLV